MNILMQLVNRQFKFLWDYDPPKDDEIMEMKLAILHDHAKKEDAKHRADIKAHNEVWWKYTLEMIDKLRETGGHPVIKVMTKEEFKVAFPAKRKKRASKGVNKVAVV